MNFFAPILAQVEDLDTGDAMRSRLITFGAYAFVMLVILVWVFFFRKQKRKRRHGHKPKPPNWELSDAQTARRGHRHRRRHTDGLPRNPSRAESGGLPPRRPDDVSPQGT